MLLAPPQALLLKTKEGQLMSKGLKQVLFEHFKKTRTPLIQQTESN